MKINQSEEWSYIPTNNQEFYETQDFLLATSIMSENCSLNYIDVSNKNRATFVFHKTKLLEKTVNDFYANKLLVNPTVYESNRKNLKSQLISLSK